MSDTSKKDITKAEATKNESKKAPAKKDGGKGFFGKISKFFREYRSEVKKISWPTAAEVIKNTIVTLIFVAFFAILIGLLDWGVGSLRDWAILQARGGEETTEVSDSDINTGVNVQYLTDDGIVSESDYVAE